MNPKLATFMNTAEYVNRLASSILFLMEALISTKLQARMNAHAIAQLFLHVMLKSAK